MMSNEEWERKMDFLLNQQARFDAEMYELKAAQARTDQRFAQTEEQIGNLAGLIHEGFGLTLSLFKKTDAEIKELRESQKLTSEELRRFIAKVDRLTGEDQNGLQN